MINSEEYKESLLYIKNYWKKITCYHPHDKQLHLGLPNKFISPNNIIFKNDQFYWDSYFTILGLVKANKNNLAKGMVDNFCYLFDRFGIIPMRNRYYNLGTSQPPFLTSMALEVFSYDKDILWLNKVMNVAEKELKKYWKNESLTETHIVYNGLSRYCDHFITHLGSEHESGWDMTSRFKDRCLDYLPIDLNSCLYKYEMDLAKFFKEYKNPRKSKMYFDMAERRRTEIDKLMWNKKKKFYYDYDYKKKVQSKFISVAGFYPMWAGLASPEQAASIKEYILPMFEYDGGVVNTQQHRLSSDLKQHDFPNGWPHQQWIVIKGLLNYGYSDDAMRIARKWLDMNHKLFMETGKFWEKHDVVKCEIGIYNPSRYPTQFGFGWTNAIFLRLINEFK
ncbi:MAG: alpha,alpha-trehalase [Bacteroidetes bacterium]|jgi:alpha,alpha-trehalase|nr:alpha,alpha-trehalase [Bacteroidota bacterium]